MPSTASGSKAPQQFSPHQVGLGVAGNTGEFGYALDLGWSRWSSYAGPLSVHVPYKDSFSVRAGLESVADTGLVFRGGYALDSSPIPRSQTGVTNLLDGTRHTIAFGTGYLWKRVRLDAHLQVRIVATRRSTKSVFDGTGTYDPYTSVPDEDPRSNEVASSNPGYPAMKSGGEVISAGLSLQVPL